MFKQIDWKSVFPFFSAFLLFLILSIFYTKPALEGKVVEQHDVQQWKAMAHQSFVVKEKTGYLPLWTNGMFSGMPAYQIAIGVKHDPVIHLNYLNTVLALGLPKPSYYLFFCALGFYILCITLGVNPWLSIVGGIGYAYCSYNPILITAGHDTKLLSIAYAPLVLASVLLVFNKKYWIGSALLLYATTSLFLQSHQQIAYYTLLMICMMCTYLFIVGIRKKDFVHLIISFLLCSTLSALSLVFVANSYLPTFEYSNETMRGGGSGLTLGVSDKKNKTAGGLDKDYAFQWSYGIGETLTLLVPNCYGGGSTTSLGEESKVAELAPEMPQQYANQLIQAATAYWGDQPSTSGPVYLGAVVFLFGFAGFFFSKNHHKWWLLSITIFGIVLAWGKHLESVNYFLFDHLPFYKKFRAPSMSLVMPALSIGLMAILFLQEIFTLEKTKRLELAKKISIAALSLAVFLIMFYFFASFANANTEALKKNLEQAFKGDDSFVRKYMAAWIDDRKSLYLKDMLRTFGIMAASMAVVWLFALDKIKKELGIAVLILLVTIDMLPIGARYFNEDHFVDPDQYEQAYSKTNADIQLDADTSYYRVCNMAAFNGNGYAFDIGNSFNDAIASYYHNTIGGYHPAKLAIYNDLIEHQLYKNIQAWAANPQAKGSFPVLNMLNMKYAIVPDQRKDNKTNIAVRNPYALGNCWLVKEVKFVHSANEEMLALDNFDPTKTAFVNDKFEKDIKTMPVADSTAFIRFIENKNDYIKYESQSSTPQFAVFSEIYYSQGWNAYVDGKKMPYMKVDYVLRGMPLEPGKHTIEFKFEPYLEQLGEQLTIYSGIASVILFILFLFLAWKDHRKELKA